MGLNTQVLEKAHKVITSAETIDDMRVLVTGHSLGGALATLAAVEIKERDLAVNVTAYTFGAPRVGNKHFTAYSNALVPNAFAIINKEDPVPRIPKFGYKRTGQRVNMSLLTGDLVVNPTYFEVSVYSSAAGRPKEHATGSYGLALALFIKSQFFISKRLPGGEEGALQLAEAVNLDTALIASNMKVDALLDPELKPAMRVAPAVLTSSTTGAVKRVETARVTVRGDV